MGRRGSSSGGEQAQLTSWTVWGRKGTAIERSQTWVQILALVAVCPGQGAQSPHTSVSSGIPVRTTRSVRHASVYVRGCPRPLEVPSLTAPLGVVSDGRVLVWPPLWHLGCPGNRSVLPVPPRLSRGGCPSWPIGSPSIKVLQRPRWGQGGGSCAKPPPARAHLLV